MTLETALARLFQAVRRGDMVLPAVPTDCRRVADVIVAIVGPSADRKKLANALGDLSLDREIRAHGAVAIAAQVVDEVCPRRPIDAAAVGCEPGKERLL